MTTELTPLDVFPGDFYVVPPDYGWSDDPQDDQHAWALRRTLFAYFGPEGMGKGDESYGAFMHANMEALDEAAAAAKPGDPTHLRNPLWQYASWLHARR